VVDVRIGSTSNYTAASALRASSSTLIALGCMQTRSQLQFLGGEGGKGFFWGVGQRINSSCVRSMHCISYLWIMMMMIIK